MNITLRNILLSLVYISIILLIFSCSATRYVPQGQYLLKQNELKLLETSKKSSGLNENELESYIQQRPNKKLLGIGFSLGIYNATDTSNHNLWQRFWRDRIGEAPIIYDSLLSKESDNEVKLYLLSQGYFNASVEDSLSVSKRRKATVHYKVTPNEPYYINSLTYNIQDKFLEKIIFNDTLSSFIHPGDRFISETLENERLRITKQLKDNGFWSFGINAISYTADSTLNNNRVDLILNIRNQKHYDSQGEESLTQYSVYKVSRITINTFYDPSQSTETASLVAYDSIYYQGVKILYDKQLTIREKILLGALRLSPNQIYNQSAIEHTATRLRTLNFTPNILFSPLSSTSKRISFADDATLTTTEKELECYIQCTPNVRQNFTTEFEASNTSDYFSTALSLGYNNENIFQGAERFNINFRGAYEFIKVQNQKNSYEFGSSVSLTAPRFWLPLNDDIAASYNKASSKISLSYNIQQRPFYRRTLVSGVFGYSWTMKNGARFTINPADVNVIDVPSVDQNFLDSLKNPYLENSYKSQLIVGASANYYYTTDSDLASNAVTFVISSDINGNLFNLVAPWIGTPITTADETFYELFGLQFAQYARMTVDISGRTNLGNSTQLAWRTLLAGGYAYGNSSTVPFERLFFAGGSNSMRGWQVRNLGPGITGPGSIYYNGVDGIPNQQGDIHLEANLELRQNFDYGLGLALFFDLGNIWMNSRGSSPEASFRLNTFYKQLGFNTGLGIRYNVANFMILRLDWGLKLHNPNMPANNRWFSNLKFNDTAFHFAIGLPF